MLRRAPCPSCFCFTARWVDGVAAAVPLDGREEPLGGNDGLGRRLHPRPLARLEDEAVPGIQNEKPGPMVSGQTNAWS